MHLLNTASLELRHVLTYDEYPYAILSHTWGDDEISFQDIQKPECRELKGYRKIKSFCSTVFSAGLEWAWIDTCCIDKSSSAELSEAINSMYDWYYHADYCYAHLADLDPAWKEGDRKTEDLRQCRWFRRGWTLQELLAPSNIHFFDSEWCYLGDKHTLLDQISSATGIDTVYIKDRTQIRKASVAARMSWAAHRQTTRLEDEAYCLMGLFNVNMPLLYGERHKAFKRLQYEIATSTDDESLFAWHAVLPQSGIFAPSPKAFAMSGDMIQTFRPRIEREPYVITNRGLRFEAVYQEAPPEFLSMLPPSTKDYRLKDHSLVPLNCARKKTKDKPFLIILKQLTDGSVVRFFPSEDKAYDKFLRDHSTFRRATVYITQPLPELEIRSLHLHHEGWSTMVYLEENAFVWYVTAPGRIESNEVLIFGDGNGFAVLTISNPSGGTPYIIALFNSRIKAGGPTYAAKYSVTMRLGPNLATVAGMVDQCHDLVKISRSNVGDEQTSQSVELLGGRHTMILNRVLDSNYSGGWVYTLGMIQR
ncbi:MAG: hypothetical protein LQ352_006334 [Teloschistes flavicans]|nr:MAG: hypothetical protein LQ352_006334 [Teloschistes flavicans]